MANNYFDFLGQNSQQDKSVVEEPKNGDLINLTVRADAECQVVCDGDFLELLKPNQIVKLKAPVGEHLLQFISIDHPEICIEKVVSWPEPGKNYLVIVNEFKQMLTDEAEKKAAEEAKRKAEEEAKAEEARRKAEADAIVTVKFTAKLGGEGMYSGPLKDGKPEGKGKVIFESGGAYEGDFHNGWRHGKGIHVWANGDRYEGDFREDMRTGNGVLSYTDGRRFEGEFLNGSSHGKTRLFFPNGDTLEGIWEKGKVAANKPNIYSFANGDRLECEGWDGGSHGKGIYYWADGRVEEMTYRHGFQVQEVSDLDYTDPDGDRGKYTGLLWKGVADGYGVMVYEDYARYGKYEGEWKEGKRMGHGVYTWANGSRYKGDFVDGKRTGHGVYTWANGNRYEGKWIDNKRHGRGVFYSANGQKKEQNWDHDKLL